jgi:probable LLM family oxidoreductase
MELGIFTFGDVQKLRNGKLGPTRDAITNALEAAKLADAVGLDVFGVGEHHTEYFPASSPSTILAAAAAITKNIILTSAVSVLSTDDPVRVYQQFATANIISGGRVEIIAGRGSSTESFPLYGYELKDYDDLYIEKLDLLLKLNALDKNEPITWEGRFRAPLQEALIVPQPEDPLTIWLATGGNPESSIRAAALDLPITYAIIGGRVSRFAPLIDLYRRAGQEYGTSKNLKVAIATPGYIAEDAKDAKDTFWKAWGSTMATLGKVRGFAAPTREHYDSESNRDGALFVGSPDEIADRIIELHKRIGHVRHIFQMDVGQLPHDKFLQSIELLGTKVAPKVRKAIKK